MFAFSATAQYSTTNIFYLNHFISNKIIWTYFTYANVCMRVVFYLRWHCCYAFVYETKGKILWTFLVVFVSVYLIGYIHISLFSLDLLLLLEVNIWPESNVFNF